MIPPSLALIPYAERYLDGRRVVLLGDATLGLAELVAERGARLVHVFDPDAARVAQAVATAERGLSFTVLRPGAEAGMRDGAFDTCLIPDLSMFSDARGLLALARRLLAAGGMVIASTPRVDGRRGESLRAGGPLNYYDFYDVLARQFRSVKMVGQVPFQGYALVDFTQDEEPEVSVDASLIDAEDREPVAYVALAGERPSAVDPYAIVQLPVVPEPEAAGQDVALARLHDERLANEARLAQEAQRAVEVLRAQEVQRAQEAQRAHEAQVKAHDETKGRVDALRTELDSLRDRHRAAEAKLAEEQRQRAEMGRALAEAGVLPRQLELKLTEEARRAEVLAAQLARHQETSERVGRELRALQERSQQAAKALAEAQAERTRLAQREEALTKRLRELEAQPRGVDPAKIDALKRRLDEAEAARAQSEAARAQAEAARAQVDAARAQAEAAYAQAESAFKQSQAARARAEAERDELRRQLDVLRGQATHHDQLRRALDEREQQLEALRQQASTFHQQLVHAHAQVQQAAVDFQEEQASHIADLSAAEAALRERARENALLRAEVERRGGMVRALLQALEAREPAPLGAAGALDRERLGYLEHELAAARSRLETLTAQVLRREGELSAAQSRLAEAERQLAAAKVEAEARSTAAQGQAAQGEGAPTELEAALAELDALRLALQQERAQRAALEARAERADPSFAAALRAQADAGSVDR